MKFEGFGDLEDLCPSGLPSRVGLHAIVAERQGETHMP